MPASNNDYTIFLLLAVFVAFLFFSSRKRKKQASTLTDSVKVGAKVVMLGGITGKIVAVNADTVTVESTPGTQIEFMKAAVRNVVPGEAKASVEAKKQVAKTPAAKSTTKTSTAKTPAKKTAK